MTHTEPTHWTSRVLNRGILGVALKEAWELEAYKQYKTKLDARDYPCFFGQNGEARGEMLYTFIPQHSLSEILTSMQQFTSLISTPDYERCSIVAFFQPNPSITTHTSFVNRFWQVLQYLHDHDPNPATECTPAHPLWEFSFQCSEMFVVGTSPTYQQRRSRNLGPGMVLIFQPRSLFIDSATSQPIAAHVRKSIHQRMLAYDGMSVHPDIGFYGDIDNREWKQYALPDDNAPEAGACPFHTAQAIRPYRHIGCP
jgi:FPC/CPF motif-containing protein YcgG